MAEGKPQCNGKMPTRKRAVPKTAKAPSEPDAIEACGCSTS
jgi:hypothetical protein